MRRMRRNETFRLTSAPAPTLPQAPATIAGLTTLGIVVNPKLKQPLLAVTDGEYVSIRSLLNDSFLQRIGRGYPSESKEAASRATGYPRVHTPDGVRPGGMGYGTSLYAALCLGAHLDVEDVVDIRMSKHGNGICSDTRDRSSDADQWWKAAVNRGLAEEDTEEHEEKEENVDVTRDVDADDLQRLVGGDTRRVVYVNDVNVDFEESETLTFEYLTFDNLTHYDLVCSAFVVKTKGVPRGPELNVLWHEVFDDPDKIVESWDDPLLALDVRGLHDDAISLLSLLYMSAGLGDAQVDAMQERWRRNLDPDDEIVQGRLFRANASGVSDVLAARRAVDWENLEDLP